MWASVGRPLQLNQQVMGSSLLEPLIFVCLLICFLFCCFCLFVLLLSLFLFRQLLLEVLPTILHLWTIIKFTHTLQYNTTILWIRIKHHILQLISQTLYLFGFDKFFTSSTISSSITCGYKVSNTTGLIESLYFNTIIETVSEVNHFFKTNPDDCCFCVVTIPKCINALLKKSYIKYWMYVECMMSKLISLCCQPQPLTLIASVNTSLTGSWCW